MKIIAHPLPRNKGMKYKRISDFALEDNRLSPFARLFLIVLVNWDKNPKARFKPNITFFAKKFNTSNRTIDRAVSELRKYGYLHTFGKKENTVWEIHEMPKMPQITSKKTRAKKAKNDAQLNVNYDAHIDVMDGVVT